MSINNESKKDEVVNQLVKKWKTAEVAWKNIYNRVGLIGTAVSYPYLLKVEGVDVMLAALGRLSCVGSLSISAATLMGLATFEYYEKTIERYKRNGEIDDVYLKFFLTSKRHRRLRNYFGTEGTWYCQRRGVELAMKDLGLSKQWNEACRQYGIKPEHDKRLLIIRK